MAEVYDRRAAGRPSWSPALVIAVIAVAALIVWLIYAWAY